MKKHKSTFTLANFSKKTTKLLKENNQTFKHIFRNSHETKDVKDITNAYIANMRQRKTFLP